jgi:hypothetical protein
MKKNIVRWIFSLVVSVGFVLFGLGHNNKHQSQDIIATILAVISIYLLSKMWINIAAKFSRKTTPFWREALLRFNILVFHFSLGGAIGAALIAVIQFNDWTSARFAVLAAWALAFSTFLMRSRC